MSAQNPQISQISQTSQFPQNPSLDRAHDKGTEAGESRIPPILRGKTYLDPLYDPAFRAFFSDEAALKDFLDALLRLPPGRRIERLTFAFADPVEFRIPGPKTVVFDIHAFTEDGRFLDIEMQRAKHSFLVDRMLLYSAFLAIKGKQAMESSPESLSLERSERDFRRYEMPEAISVWLCNFHPVEGFEGYRDEWSLYSGNALERAFSAAISPDGKKPVPRPVSEKLRYIVVDLPNFVKERGELSGPESREDLWLYLLTHAGERDCVRDFGDPLASGALERIRVGSAQDELLKEQAKEMVTQDEIDVRIADGVLRGRRLGREEGLAEGLVEGMNKGSLSAKREIATAMLREKLLTEAEIARHFGLSLAEIEALKRTL
ncbi:MAG: PD-(D/E)XK nuclease family transposase [Fibrobacter intestinalis]|uniref:PD-(D/E)XK nuclease family transposase n=1 Tax=Fibrobacter intestinalis TaxID=28122 RepID=UPI003F01F886